MIWRILSVYKSISLAKMRIYATYVYAYAPMTVTAKLCFHACVVCAGRLNVFRRWTQAHTRSHWQPLARLILSQHS